MKTHEVEGHVIVILISTSPYLVTLSLSLSLFPSPLERRCFDRQFRKQAMREVESTPKCNKHTQQQQQLCSHTWKRANLPPPPPHHHHLLLRKSKPIIHIQPIKLKYSIQYENQQQQTYQTPSSVTRKKTLDAKKTVSNLSYRTNVHYITFLNRIHT